VTIISLVLYGRAVLILGASGGSAFGALVPALSAVLAIPLLREWPTISVWIGIVFISGGVYLASGGPRPVLMTRRDNAACRDPEFHVSPRRYRCSKTRQQLAAFTGRPRPQSSVASRKAVDRRTEMIETGMATAASAEKERNTKATD
jgi:hypothetical protein